MFSDFLSQTLLKEDVDLVLEELELLLGSFYGIGEKGIKFALENKIRKTTAETVKSASETEVRETKEQLENLSVVSLALAFEPSLLQLKTIVDWIRSNGVPDCVLDLRIDPKIIAGAIVSYKGKYKDLSFQTAYEQIPKLS
jgi:F0F1-type ATP synthase delta subunit